MLWNFGKRRPSPNDTSPPDFQEDEEILAAIRALQAGGSSDAFELIYRRFYRPLFNFFSNQRLLREEADDLVQITFVRAYEKIHQYRFEARFQSWLLQIGENVWRNAVREKQAAKRAARLEHLDPTDFESEKMASAASIADKGPNPEEMALEGERQHVLRKAIDSLPPGMQLCTKLLLFAGLKYREISDVTGIGLNTVRSQLFEARKRLKPVLGKYFQGIDF